MADCSRVRSTVTRSRIRSNGIRTSGAGQSRSLRTSAARPAPTRPNEVPSCSHSWPGSRSRCAARPGRPPRPAARARASASGSAGSTVLSAAVGLAQLRRPASRPASCRASTAASRNARSRTPFARSTGRAAIRAVDDLDVLAQLGDLLRRQRPDEVLLLQEVEERGQPAVAVRALRSTRTAWRAACPACAAGAPRQRGHFDQLGVAADRGLPTCSPMTRNRLSVRAGRELQVLAARRTRATGTARTDR